jgi:hypothetical protein
MCPSFGSPHYGPTNCYHCGADIPTLTLDALNRALAGSSN